MTIAEREKIAGLLLKEAARGCATDGTECCYAPWTCCHPDLLRQAAALIAAASPSPSVTEEEISQAINSHVEAVRTKRITQRRASTFSEYEVKKFAVAAVLALIRGERRT